MVPSIYSRDEDKRLGRSDVYTRGFPITEAPPKTPPVHVPPVYSLFGYSPHLNRLWAATVATLPWDPVAVAVAVGQLRVWTSHTGEKKMDTQNNQVTVVDVRMPFMSMVVFMVKWAIASIPALLILFMLAAVVFGVLGEFFA